MKLLTFIRQRSFARYVMVDLTDAARRLGWGVKWLDLEGVLEAARGRSPDEKARVVSETLADIERFDPRLVFSYGLEYLDRVFQDALPDVRSRFHELLRRPAVYYLCDFGFPFDGASSPEAIDFIAPLQDWGSLLLCWDREATEVVKRNGVSNVSYLPMAVNERMFYPDHDVLGAAPISALFVGGPTAERISLLEAVADLGLVIHGYDAAGWQASEQLRQSYQGEILERNPLRAVYQRAKISINVTRAHGPSSLNMRVYEAMACGSLLLTDDKSDARTLFKEGTEVVTYRYSDDLGRKVRYYLTHETERAAIAAAGMEKVRQAHTYAARLRSVEPTLRRFDTECSLFGKLREFLSQDPAQAVRFVRFLEVERLITLNRDNLRLMEARAHLALGDTGRADTCVNDVLELNPKHLNAEALRRQIREAA
ncbi:MAG: glycosyltransferase [Vicinamibacterales bacterium]|jgi:hypothetical protein|nr:glycosyltransferase [Vicinamibacterales bacterium]